MGANSEVAEESEGVSENKHEKLKKNTLRKIWDYLSLSFIIIFILF